MTGSMNTSIPTPSSLFSEILTCRKILSFMVFTGFILQQTLRVNITLVITDMTSNNSANHFSWDESQKGTIIGVYFWGTFASLPGGRLSDRFGTRLIMGSSLFIASVLAIITPFLAHLHYYALVASRLVLGLAMSAFLPAAAPLGVRWVSPTGMSKFMSHTKSSLLGGAVTQFMCGFLISKFGWESVFYVTGAMSLIWTFCWFYLVYNSPMDHPRISVEEKGKILAKAVMCIGPKRGRVPWVKMLTCRPVFALTVAVAAFTLVTAMGEFYMPMYLYQVFGLQAKENGILCSLPYLASYAANFGSAYLADKWVKTNKFQPFTVRKIFMFFSVGAHAFIFLSLVFFGNNIVFSVVAFVLCFSCIGCSSAAISANMIELAPAYSGTLSGYVFSVGSVVCFLETMFIARVTKDVQQFQQWKIIFWLLVVSSSLGNVVYFLCGSSEGQSFNDEDVKSVDEGSESEMTEMKTNGV